MNPGSLLADERRAPIIDSRERETIGVSQRAVSSSLEMHRTWIRILSPGLSISALFSSSVLPSLL